MKLKSLYVQLPLTWLILVFLSLPSWAQEALENDALIEGEFTRIGQFDEYSFMASVGDLIYLNVADRDGTALNPSVLLFDPSGNVVETKSSSITASIFAYEALSDGEYGVLVEDTGANNIGFYSLYFARVPGANEGGILENDTRLMGTLELGDIDTFTFNASVGDSVDLNVAVQDDTQLAPVVTLFDPAGGIFATAVGSETASLKNVAIEATGVWTVLVSESNSDHEGDYELFFARSPGANEKGLLPNDAQFTASLAPGDIDTWVFDADAGDHIHVNVASKSGTSFIPNLSIYKPDGSLLDGVRGSNVNGNQVDTTGRYTVVVVDSRSRFAGDYEIFFAISPGANEKGLLPNDARRAASLALGDIDTWAFDADVGDRINLNVADTNNTTFTPQLSIYKPDGSLFANAIGSASATISGIEVEDAGRYMVVVTDQFSNRTGDYELYFANAPGANELDTISGRTSFSKFLQLGDIDTFEFGAAAGATIRINMGDSETTNFSPSLVVYDEAGTVVSSATNSSVAQANFVTNAAGFYTVVMQDQNANHAGLYSLDYVYLGTTPPTRTRYSDLDPNVWHLLGVPGNTSGTLGELFDSSLDLASYNDSSSSTGWTMFAYEPDIIDPESGVSGVYRTLSLSEPVPQGSGFWLIHLNDAQVRVNLPLSTTDAVGTTGGGCAEGFSCLSRQLGTATTGGWTIGAVPSKLMFGVEDFRFLTDSAAPICEAGCTMQEAFDSTYASSNGFWVYEPSTEQYRLQVGVDSVALWSGFWLRANAAATPGSPELMVPVQ